MLGLGAIGRELSLRLRAFGTRLIGVGRRPASDLDPDAAALIDAYYPVDELAEALSQSDLLVLGRGPLVDHDALIVALRDGQLAGAGLDVFWHEPIDPADPVLREKGLATPHVGAVTLQAYRATAQRFAANVERLRRGEPLNDRAT